jgi:hypothetical protein
MSSSISEQTKQRRRILKAAVGAPVIYTLSSGAALAAASSVSCLDRAGNVIDDQAFFDATGMRLAEVESLQTGSAVRIDGHEYVYDNGEFIAASCWASLDVASTTSSSRIV